MKSGTCPKCGSTEIAAELGIRGGQGHPPYVDIKEPEPLNRPFIWVPKSEQSQFVAYICGGCGYTEFYAANYKSLNEGYKQGHRG